MNYMKIKSTVLIAIVTAAALLISACQPSGTSQAGNDASDSSQTQAQTQDQEQAQGSEQAGEGTIKVQGQDAENAPVEVELPMNPQRIVVLDMAMLDIVNSLGENSRVVGTANISLEYLQKGLEGQKVENVGTLQEPSLETIMALEPDVILMGGRAADYYTKLQEIAPTLRLRISEEGVLASVKSNAEKIASLFGKQADVVDLIAPFEARIAKLKEAANGAKAIVSVVTNGGLNILGDDGRMSIIGREIGFTNVGVAAEESTSTHGNEASFEFLLEKNPEYVFVLDRDAAIATEGAKLASEIMDNELVHKTQASKEDKIIILENPGVWYLAEGGIQALDTMLGDLEKALIP